MEKTLPEGWERKKLKEVCVFIMGQAPPSSSYNNEGKGVLFIRSGDFGKLYPKSSTYTTNPLVYGKEGDVFLCVVGATSGKVNLGISSAITRSLFALRPNKNLLQKYLYFYLKKNYRQLNNIKSGSAQGILNSKNLSTVEIPLPSLETQHKVVAILEKAEETKELRAQADELTNKLLQSVFLEMFGDPLKNPKGWERRKLSAVSHINMGQSPPGESYSKSGMGTPLLNGPTEFGDTHPTAAQWTDKPTKMCNIGDILFCVRGATAGRMNWADQRYCIGRGIAAIHSIPNLSDNRYLYQILLMNYERFQATGKGSTFINISSSELGNLIVPVPPLPLQQKFAQIVDKGETLGQTQNQSHQQLNNLFNTLMQKAFKGELTT